VPAQAAHSTSRSPILEEEPLGTNNPSGYAAKEAGEDHERPSNGSWNPFRRWGRVRTQDKKSGKEAMRAHDLEMQDPTAYPGNTDISRL
jgi:hypothetical protein